MDSAEPLPNCLQTIKAIKLLVIVFCDNSLFNKVGVNIQPYKAEFAGCKVPDLLHHTRQFLMNARKIYALGEV